LTLVSEVQAVVPLATPSACQHNQGVTNLPRFAWKIAVKMVNVCVRVCNSQEMNTQTADVHVDLKVETASLQQFPAVGLVQKFLT